MPRLPRVYIENILYYVTSRGGHNQNIFIAPDDYSEYISLIGKYKEQYGFKLFSYCLLPNHLHMLVELKNNIGISNIMHDINSLYTKLFNSRYNRKGHLFQERFRASFAEKETYLLDLTRYIHLNPVSTGLVDNPQDYAYSSYQKFLDPSKRINPDINEEVEETFSVLKGREEMFKKFSEDFDLEALRAKKQSQRKKRILGTKEFQEKIKRIIEGAVIEQKKEAEPVKKNPIGYILVSVFAVIALVATMTYSSKKQKEMKSEYEKTLLVYERTLSMLKDERNRAIIANEDLEDYTWKIRLTQNAMDELRKEEEEKMEIDGYLWIVAVTQTRGPSYDFQRRDFITIEDLHVAVESLAKEGFKPSRYSKKILKNENIYFEAIQNNEDNARVVLRGEWDGSSLKGTLSRIWKDGIRRDFSFISVGNRTKIGR
ncbi:MAG: transposase [Candidatus Omnitrophota bacterium]